MAILANGKAGSPATSTDHRHLDIVIAGNMAVSDMAGLRISGEADAAAHAGYRVGLLHLAAPGDSSAISPEVNATVRRHDLVLLDPEAAWDTSLLILHSPRNLDDALRDTSRVKALRTVVVSDGSTELGTGFPVGMVRKTLSIVPATAGLSFASFPGIKIEREVWPLAIGTSGPTPPDAGPRPLRVGFVASPGSSLQLERFLPAFTKASIEAVVWTERAAGPVGAIRPGDFSFYAGAETSLSWFLNKIDALVLTPEQAATQAFDIVASTALAAGKLVVLPAAVKERYRDAALYMVHMVPEESVESLLLFKADASACAKLSRKALAFAARQFAPEKFIRRIDKLIGGPKRRKTAAKAEIRKHRPRVIFLPKGGVGLGHVARTLAIARRANRAYDPIFVTLAESAGLIESFGYRAEYIPSSYYAGIPPDEWAPWFQAELQGLIDAYDADAVVFDGSDPSDALISAVASRPQCKLGWIRRGMWEPGYDPSLDKSHAFDMIVEPGEISRERDRGATAARRHEAIQVAPITLLDPDELLTREDAARAIGFDPAKPSVLLQLGSGDNRDIIGTLDTLITLLKQYPDLQIALAEWSNTPGTLKLWRGIKLLKGAPLSLYFNAFDFAISAAGYNTFHESIGFRLPTIFIPNIAPGMDDQTMRAQFAQEKGAAIELPQSDIGELPGILDMMTKDNFRDVMRRNCGMLYAGNGAADASARIAALVN